MPASRSFKVLEAQSALNTSGTLGPNEVGGASYVTAHIDFGPGTTAGAVQIEEASSVAYGGTWSALGAPVAWAAASRSHVVAIAGPHLALRARISTAVANGTVDVTFNVTK
jgi:hypothetical protein